MGNTANLKPFQPGENWKGNNKGRIKGSKNITTQLRKYLKTREIIQHPTDPEKTIKGTTMDVIAMKLIEKARDGNLVAIRMIQDRDEGTPMQHHEIRNLDKEPPTDPLAVTENALIIKTLPAYGSGTLPPSEQSM